MQNLKNIYIKTEPAGEIGLGRLSDEDVQLVESVYRSDRMKNTKFVQRPFRFFDQRARGVFMSKQDTIDGELPRYERIETISLKKGGRYEDGWYLIYSGLSKCSIEFELPIDNGDFDIDDLLFEFQEIDLPELSDELYGELKFNVLSDCKYQGKSVGEFHKAELIDRGIDREVRVLEIKEGNLYLVYKYIKRSDEIVEYWGNLN